MKIGKRKYYVRITTPGYIYIVITIVLSVGAVNTANNLLHIVASSLLALMLLSGTSSFLNFFFLHITLIPPEEVFAGMPAPFRLIVNKKRGNSFFLTFETPYGRTKLPFISGEVETSLWLKFATRGRVPLDSVKVDSGFPMGFFRRFTFRPVNQEIFVYPSPIPTLFPPLSGKSSGDNEGDSRYGELSDEIKELCTYTHSDPLKWIDWKATARKGTTIVRDFYRLAGDTLIINLTNKLSDDRERQISEAAYLIILVSHKFSYNLLKNKDLSNLNGNTKNTCYSRWLQLFLTRTYDCRVIIEGHRKKLSMRLILPDEQIALDRGEVHKIRLLKALALA
ncbi:MAG TPA: DUF58 domain-containing protein [Thermodesulfovibrionia bacterium]|nr:DUF58 domain-containing protein [Thermodesulfovibrionia bacterium]